MCCFCGKCMGLWLLLIVAVCLQGEPGFRGPPGLPGPPPMGAEGRLTINVPGPQVLPQFFIN